MPELPGTTADSPGRHLADRRAAPRGGRRPEDRDGFFPRVMVVDVDEASRRMQAEYLRLRKFEVLAVADGTDALLSLDSFRPHAVITDLVVGSVDAYAVVASAASRGIPSLIFAGAAPFDARGTETSVPVVQRPAPLADVIERLRDIFRIHPPHIVHAA